MYTGVRRRCISGGRAVVQPSCTFLGSGVARKGQRAANPACSHKITGLDPGISNASRCTHLASDQVDKKTHLVLVDPRQHRGVVLQPSAFSTHCVAATEH
jgi:hypothetical protein